MRYGSIYIITNKLNGKQYVGQTIFPVVIRWTAHVTTPSKSAIHQAICKYGVENFIFEELCSAQNETDLNALEEFLIKSLKTYGSNGYNMTFGGDASSGKFTKEVRQKMCIAKLGKSRGPYKDRTIVKVNQSGSVEIKTSIHAQRLEGESMKIEYNPSTSPRRPSKYEQLKEEIIAFYEKSNSSYAVAEKFGLDKSHVCRYLKKWDKLHSQSKAASIRNINRYSISRN